jgi:ATP-binding cassette subfamily G (WHITE) protein 2 (PDR)
MALLTYYLFRVANFSSLTAKLHKTKKGAKTKQVVDKVEDGAAQAAQQGAHPGERSGEKDAGTA